MRKGQFYILVSILIIISVLFIFKIAKIGNEDYTGGFTIGVISVLVVYGVYQGVVWLKWIGIIGFSLLAFGMLMAGLEHKDYLFFISTLGYLFVVWKLTLVRTSNTTPSAVKAQQVQVREIQLPANTFETDNTLHEYPTLLKRIQALFIDGMILLLFMVVVMLLTDNLASAFIFRVTALIITSLLYEPLLTVYYGTIGQQALGIRVRNAEDPSKRISLVQAYARVIVKSFLGWLSFITIHSNAKHLAIHDFAGSSVMIKI